MTKSGQILIRGALWTYSAQIVTIVFQFGYSAVTSRIISASGFGNYTIALIVTGLLTLLAGGGLGQSASRLASVNKSSIRPLTTLALLYGLAGALILLSCAHSLATLWGSPNATQLIQLLAINAGLSPFLGLTTGILARQGQFRKLSTLTVIANLLGMAIGLIAVSTLRENWTLIVSTVVTQVTLSVLMIFETRDIVLGVSTLRQARQSWHFGGKLILAQLMQYLVIQMKTVAVSRGISTDALGYFNRAATLTSIPFQQIQIALVRALYPEFRHDINEPTRAFRVWTDLLIITSGIFIPLSVIASVLIPQYVNFIFGSGWDEAARLAGVLAIVGGVQIVSLVLSAAVETLGRFAWIWSTDTLLLLVQIPMIYWIVTRKDLLFAGIAILITDILRHCWQILLTSKNGYIDFQRLIAHYLKIITMSILLGLAYYQVSRANILGTSLFVHTVQSALLTMLITGLGYTVRNRLLVWRLLMRYNIVPVDSRSRNEKSIYDA